MHHKGVQAVAILLALALSGSFARAQSKSHYIVFAISSGDETDWKLTVGNIRNLLAGFPSGSTKVEAVAYGPGLSFVRKISSVGADIEALEAKHVRFLACENSMRNEHVLLTDLIPGVATVPSGIVEVVTKQEQGWNYIKAGR